MHSTSEVTFKDVAGKKVLHWGLCNCPGGHLLMRAPAAGLPLSFNPCRLICSLSVCLGAGCSPCPATCAASRQTLTGCCSCAAKQAMSSGQLSVKPVNDLPMHITEWLLACLTCTVALVPL